MVETRFQTSFIPKRPLAQAGVAYRRDAGGMGFFSIIATIIFIIAALLALGLFLYTSFLNKSIETNDGELKTVYEALDKTALNTFVNLGKKTEAAESLLARHIAFSRVTDFFESITLKNVRYTIFTFEAVPGGTAKITLKGEAQSYAAIASQAYVLSVHSGVSKVSFGGFILGEAGGVNFDAVIELKPVAYAYKATLDELSLNPLTE